MMLSRLMPECDQSDTRWFAAGKSITGANLPAAQSAIVPVVLGDPTTALEASTLLERQGFLVTAIRPPTVPAGTARLRITFTAAHKEADVARLADAVRPFVR